MPRPIRQDDSSNFTGQELTALMQALVDGTGRPVSEPEVDSFVRWAWRARITATLLEMVMSGLVIASWEADDWRFSRRPGVHLEAAL